jgi:hypothetical protein
VPFQSADRFVYWIATTRLSPLRDPRIETIFDLTAIATLALHSEGSSLMTPTDWNHLAHSLCMGGLASLAAAFVVLLDVDDDD